MEDAAEAVAPADPEVVRRLRVGKRLQWWCGLAEGAVRAVLVEVPFLLGQHRGGVSLVEDEDPVQQFAAEAADEPFRDGVRPRRLVGVVRTCMPAVTTVSKTRLNFAVVVAEEEPE